MKKNLHIDITAFTKSNSKWIIDLKIKPKNYQTSRKRHREKFLRPWVW